VCLDGKAKLWKKRGACGANGQGRKT
jgi:hypothetical protein